MIMSTQTISQTSIDDFVERVNRMYNRSQKLSERIMNFSQQWGIDLNNNAPEQKVGTSFVAPDVESQATVHVEPAIHTTPPVQEEPVEMDMNHDDIDLDSLIAGIKLDDDELTL